MVHRSSAFPPRDRPERNDIALVVLVQAIPTVFRWCPSTVPCSCGVERRRSLKPPRHLRLTPAITRGGEVRRSRRRVHRKLDARMSDYLITWSARCRSDGGIVSVSDIKTVLGRPERRRGRRSCRTRAGGGHHLLIP